MNLLFITLIDFMSIDEQGIYTDLLREFVKNGHNLSIVSPTEKKLTKKAWLIESENCRILKLRIGRFQKTNLIEKGITILTLENRIKLAVKKYFKYIKFDLIIYSTPPITILKAVKFIKNRDNSMTYLLLKDIFPQNAIDLGILSHSYCKKYILQYFRRKEVELYRISDYIGCMSRANVDFLLKQNMEISLEKVGICANSIEPRKKIVSKEEKLANRDKYFIPRDKTVFIYGGNLGKPQGIEFLIKCILKNEENTTSFFVIVGSGTEYNKVKQIFTEVEIKNSILISQLPIVDYQSLVNSSDVGLIFLDKRFTIPNFPSRILSYMQASIPILAATDKNTDLGQIIEKGNFGFWCESTNANEFNKLVLKLCDSTIRKTLGANSWKYLVKNYHVKDSYNAIINRYNEKKEG